MQLLRNTVVRLLAAGFALVATRCPATTCDPGVDETKFTSTLNTEYMVYNGSSQGLDIYKPTQGSSSLLVFVHGGAWEHSSKSTAKFVATAQRLAMLGFTVASFDYPLYVKNVDGSITNGFPAGISALRCGVRSLMANAASVGFDPAHVSYFGTSAGANLVGLMAYDSVDDPNLDLAACPYASTPLPRARSVVMYYPPTDLLDAKVPTDLPYAQNPNGSGPVAFSTVPWVIDYLNGDVAQFGRRASVLPYLYPGAMGTKFGSDLKSFIVHGSRDQTVDIRQSKLLADRLQSIGMYRAFIVEKGWSHAFSPFRAPSSCDLQTFLNQYAR